MRRFALCTGLVVAAALAAVAHAHGGPPPRGGMMQGPPGGQMQGNQAGGMQQGAPQGGSQQQGPQGGMQQGRPQGGQQGGQQGGPQGGGMQRGPGGPPPAGTDPRAIGALLRAADADDSKDVTSDEWTAFLDGLTADANGVVDLDDFASKLPEPPQGWPADTAERDAGFVRAFDADADGAVTKTDLQAIYDRHVEAVANGEVPPQGPPPRGECPRPQGPNPECAAHALMWAADADESKDVSADEWTAFLDGLVADENGVVDLSDLAAKLPEPPQGWPEDADELAAGLVRAYDYDADGTVTKTDLQSMFDRLDKDADGAAEPAELRPAKPLKGRDLRAGKALAIAADADASRDVTADEWTAFLDGLVVDDAGAVSLDDLASKLPEPKNGWPAVNADRDAKLVQCFDRDEDGAVTKADLQAMFDALDRNQDGALDASDAPRRRKR